MRNFKFLLLFVAVMFMAAAVTQAQDVTLSQGTYKAITVIADGDTIEGNTMEVGKTFLIDKSDPYGYRFQMSCDSLNAAGTTLLILKGGITTDNMQPIDTVVWSMTSSDTTALFDQTSVTESWRFIGGFIKGTNASTKAKLGAQHIKLLLK